MYRHSPLVLALAAAVAAQNCPDGSAPNTVNGKTGICCPGQINVSNNFAACVLDCTMVFPSCFPYCSFQPQTATPEGLCVTVPIDTPGYSTKVYDVLSSLEPRDVAAAVPTTAAGTAAAGTAAAGTAAAGTAAAGTVAAGTVAAGTAAAGTAAAGTVAVTQAPGVSGQPSTKGATTKATPKVTSAAKPKTASGAAPSPSGNASQKGQSSSSSVSSSSSHGAAAIATKAPGLMVAGALAGLAFL